jgi:hypothetical protein
MPKKRVKGFPVETHRGVVVVTLSDVVAATGND